MKSKSSVSPPTFGLRLKWFARERFGSLKALADAVEIDYTQMSKYATGETKPRFEALEKLLGVGLSLDWAVGGRGSMALGEPTTPGLGHYPVEYVEEAIVESVRQVIGKLTANTSTVGSIDDHHRDADSKDLARRKSQRAKLNSMLAAGPMLPDEAAESKLVGVAASRRRR
jgi:hypothetical protein